MLQSFFAFDRINYYVKRWTCTRTFSAVNCTLGWLVLTVYLLFVLHIYSSLIIRSFLVVCSTIRVYAKTHTYTYRKKRENKTKYLAETIMKSNAMGRDQRLAFEWTSARLNSVTLNWCKVFKTMYKYENNKNIFNKQIDKLI